MSLRTKLNITDVDLSNKRVVIRTDYNVQIKEDKIVNNSRIDLSLPSINYALSEGARYVVIISHLGRPNGKFVQNLSLLPVYNYLQSKIPNIQFITDGLTSRTGEILENSPQGSIFLLENIRFHPEELGYTINDNGKEETMSDEIINLFTDQINKLGDVYINDAFAISHRDSNSVSKISIPIRASGYLLRKEVTYLKNTLENPNRPFLAILGGESISDKLQLIYNLLDKVDDIIIAGGMCFTFLKIMYDIDIGSSLYDPKGSHVVSKIVSKAELKGVRLHFPVDFIIGSSFSHFCKTKTITVDEGVDDGWMGLDIGPESIKLFQELIYDAKTIIWNGPVGAYELKSFTTGSQILLHDVIENTICGGISIIEGTDTINMVGLLADESGISHISSGNGAALQLLEGNNLPGYDCLTEKI